MNAPTIKPSVSHAFISVAELAPHPSNPRIEPRQDIIDQLAERMAEGFDPAHALIVRPVEDGYQIISGHHRLLAAQQAGINELPCWVRELSDDDAYMQLVLCNTQSELHALEEGKHAAESGMDLKAYAGAAGKKYGTLNDKVRAWRVYSAVEPVLHMQNKTEAKKAWRAFGELDAAPKWLWPALVAKMLEGEWTIATTKQMVANVKGVEPPPSWTDEAQIAVNLLAGQLSVNDLPKFQGALQSAAIRDTDLLNAVRVALMAAKPSLLSAAHQIIGDHEDQQSERDTAARKAKADQQRKQEAAKQRVVRLRQNCSLDEWKGLAEDEQQMLLAPVSGQGGVFNKQKNEAIEWAQWSWNPVTGCKHDCPYCYARDIALSERMREVYPNGWEPTFRSNALNAPENTKVPKEAALDTRYRNVFTCSMADLFGRWVPEEWIDAVMGTVRDSPDWNFLFLTKFPQRLKDVDIPDNAWMGTTVDMQARVRNAEKAFADVGGKVKWLSVEPMIEPLQFDRLDLFDWVVIGGASGSTQTPAWRPPFAWVYDLVNQCREAGCKVYMKTNLFGEPKDGKGKYGANARLLELPFDAPIIQDPHEAPAAFHYLGKKQ